ncbi:MAG: efflux RND transporter permease subunit, partial [Saprospiraceae bacterium]|nr:efflux RND transporter permease subunit [Saprospiraceae bacterium]
MKKIISYFIKYPVSVNVMLLAFVIFGTFGALNLKSSFFPLAPPNQIFVEITYPGASPYEIEEGVVLKIEENLRGLVGVERITSVSRENSATITVETYRDYDIDVILQDVKNAVDRVPSFPVGMEPPVVYKAESIQEAISMTLSGENVNLKTLKEKAREVEDDLRKIEGITQIALSGFPEEEIEIAVRENTLREYDLTFEDIRRAVAQANILTTGGNIRTSTEDYLIRASNKVYYADEMDMIPVKTDPSGRIIRLIDIAKVRDRWSETPEKTYFDGKEAVRIEVSSTNNEDLIAAAQAVNEYIDRFNQENPGLSLDVTRDASIVLIQRTQLLAENGLIGICLVLLLLSIFLRPRLALWVAIGLPISFFGMFIFAGSLGVTINVLSLFAMIVVIGILVDDGIVISENIYHHYEKGKSPIQAAIDGTMEVLPPIVSAILTTIVAFGTFFFLDGRVGTFFGEVSTVVTLTLSISLIEALIILPSHLAHSKALTPGVKKFKINDMADDLLVWVRDNIYVPLLRFSLKYKVLAIAVPTAIFALTIGSIGGGIIKTTFFPAISSDRVQITLRMPQGTDETITDSLLQIIEKSAITVGDSFNQIQTGNKDVIESIIREIGPGSSSGSLRVNLLPGEERDFGAAQIANAIQEEVGPIYGVESLEYSSGTNFGGKPVAVSLSGENIEELKAAKKELREALIDDPKLKDITDNDPQGIKEIRLKLRNEAYLLGLTYDNVASQVRAGFFGAQVQRLQRGRDEVKVWVRYDETNRSSLRDLEDMYLQTPGGEKVPLSEVATYDIQRGEVAINHLDGERQITVSADLKDPKESATDMIDNVRENVMPDILAKYPTVKPLYEGQNREASKVSNSARKVIPVVLFLIYGIIAFTFRSYSQPILLIMMVPLSLIGVAWGHWLHDFAINILSWLGIIALIGIMVNDGLVLIGKFNGFLRDDLSFRDALVEAGRSRFRAIFLTSITTIAGLAPLMFETSRQAQFLIPMAISISYGIFIATFLTL